MVHLIKLDAVGHKVGLRITNREKYFELRNGVQNKENFMKARCGDDNAKRHLLQFNYNAQLADGGPLAGCDTASSTFSHDIDCGDEQACKELVQKILDKKEELGLLELSVSARWGLHAVCRRKLGMTVLENQVCFSILTQTEMDCNAHDFQRVMFTGPADEQTLLYLDDAIFEEPLSEAEGKEEYQRLKAREENGEEELPANYVKGEKHYRPWEPPTLSDNVPAQEATTSEVQAVPQAEASEMPTLFDHPVVDYLNTLYPLGAPKGQRHNTILKLANDLIILLDNDETKVKQTLLHLPWVNDVIRERGEKELDNIIDSSKKLMRKRESETFYPLRPSQTMQHAIETLNGRKYKDLINSICPQTGLKSSMDEQVELLTNLGKRIQKFFHDFPLLALFCYGRKLLHFPAALFVGSGFCTTLMTRCWFKFYPTPGRKCRLNSLVMVIGRPGSGKHFAVDLYDLLMEPIKKEDTPQINALNAWNRENVKNSGAKGNSQERPSSVYRCLPANSSRAGLREALFNAREVIDGEEMMLHVSIFDSELNNTLEQMNKAHMDAFKTLWLKSFHNEMGGSLLKTSTAPVGEIPIHFNACYTGTYDAFAKIATGESYSSGITTRFVCVPMWASPFEMMEYKEYTDKDKNVEDQIREWAYKLNKSQGEIPSQELSKALFQWTARKMAEAGEEQSEVLSDMCKRPAWVGIRFALPFIISRHWGEMVEENGKFKCGAGFHLDKHDIDLAVFIAQAQYDLQQYFFYELGQQQQEKQSELKFGRKLQTRTQLAFKRLPEIFTSDDLMKEYEYDNRNSVNSQLKRLQDDNRIKKIRSGEDKGKYRKVIP